MKTIFKIRFSYFFLITAFICILTGRFHEFSFFMSLIFIHECGHALMARILHWNIKEILIYPFGGITIFEEKINRPMKEEFMILIAGPLMQIAFFHLISRFVSIPPFISTYHQILLLFNLIPIYPLDGGKLSSFFYQTLFPYLFSHKLMIASSYFFCIFFLLYFLFLHFSFVIFLYFFLLFFKIFEEKRNENLLFQKFLLERAFYPFSFPYKKRIEGRNFKKMYRDHFHIFHIDKKWVGEKELLEARFTSYKKRY